MPLFSMTSPEWWKSFYVAPTGKKQAQPLPSGKSLHRRQGRNQFAHMSYSEYMILAA